MCKCSPVSGILAVVPFLELQTEATEIVMVQEVALLGLKPGSQPWHGN